MFVYFNYRKDTGYNKCACFTDESNATSFVINEIRTLVTNKSANYSYLGPPKEINDFMAKIIKFDLDQVKELISKYEKWVAPMQDPAILHSLQDLRLIKDY